MPIHRRDFMKLLGVSLASLFLTRCRPPFVATCYAPIAPPATPGGASARDRLRQYWLRFTELAESSPEDTENRLGNRLVAGHRAEIDELVAGGEISAPAAELVQEAYSAAVYHVWRLYAPITCYEPMMLDYAPTSAGVLVQQAEVLNTLSAQGTIDPDTLAKARSALEHDLSYYALSEAEIQQLYERILAETQEQGEPVPDFGEVPLELTPEAEEAAQFLISLLTEK